jgi:hypothetical protein
MDQASTGKDEKACVVPSLARKISPQMAFGRWFHLLGPEPVSAQLLALMLNSRGLGLYSSLAITRSGR